MNCKSVTEKLKQSEWQVSGLSAEEQRHAASCSHCQKELRFFASLQNSLSKYSPSESQNRSLNERILNSTVRNKQEPFFLSLRWLLKPGFAFVVAAILLTLIQFLVPGEKQNKVELFSLSEHCSAELLSGHIQMSGAGEGIDILFPGRSAEKFFELQGEIKVFKNSQSDRYFYLNGSGTFFIGSDELYIVAGSGEIRDYLFNKILVPDAEISITSGDLNFTVDQKKLRLKVLKGYAILLLGSKRINLEKNAWLEFSTEKTQKDPVLIEETATAGEPVVVIEKTLPASSSFEYKSAEPVQETPEVEYHLRSIDDAF